MVEYKDFCREIELCFGNDQLEKNPLIDSEQHLPRKQIDDLNITPDELDLIRESIRRIAGRVSKMNKIYMFIT